MIPKIFNANGEGHTRYIIKAAFSQEQMAYITADRTPDGTAKGIYPSKNKKNIQNRSCTELAGTVAPFVCPKCQGEVGINGFIKNTCRIMTDTCA